MAKSFKLRLYKMISTTFQSCRSKDRASLPLDPVFFSSKSQHRRSAAVDEKWQEDEKWDVLAKVHDESERPRRKIYNSSASGGDSGDDDIISALPPLPPPRIRRRKTKHGRLSTSSESGLFSHEDDGESLETETLISFSTDSSSEYVPQLETIREKPPQRRRKKGKKRSKENVNASDPVLYRPSSVSENESPARLSAFKKLLPFSVEGKVKDSFAVVKKSDDPYDDFKRSMVEMILEKQMFEESDLQQLLQCFLSLNCQDHHKHIVQAFVEIWEAMFSAS